MSLRDRDRDRVSVRVVGCGLCLEWEEYVGEVGLVLDVAVGDALLGLGLGLGLGSGLG